MSVVRYHSLLPFFQPLCLHKIRAASLRRFLAAWPPVGTEKERNTPSVSAQPPYKVLKQDTQPAQKDHRLPTRLTQQQRSEGRGKEFLPSNQSSPSPRNICPGCGATTLGGKHCPKCGREISRAKLIELAKAGRAAALKPESRRKVSETQRRHNDARQAWSASMSSSRITEETYLRQIQPRLMAVTISALASTLGVSIGAKLVPRTKRDNTKSLTSNHCSLESTLVSFNRVFA